MKEETEKSSSSWSWIIHVVLWLFFVQIIFDLGGLYYSLEELFSEQSSRVDEAFLLVPFLVAIFYGNARWLAPRFLNRSDWLGYFFAIIAFFAVAVLLSYGVFVLLENAGMTMRIDRFDFLDASLVLYPISTDGEFKLVPFRNCQKKL